MRSALIVGVLFCSCAIALGQSTTANVPSKAVMQQLLLYVTDGSLLTPTGWNKGGELFVHQSPHSGDKSIAVVGDDISSQETWERGNQAEFYVTYRDFGRIDSSLRYSPPDARYPKISVRYHLILTNKSGVSVPLNKSRREWKIEQPQSAPWVGLQAAIQYVTEGSRKTTDSIIKRNASFTSRELKKFQPKPKL